MWSFLLIPVSVEWTTRLGGLPSDFEAVGADGFSSFRPAQLFLPLSQGHIDYSRAGMNLLKRIDNNQRCSLLLISRRVVRIADDEKTLDIQCSGVFEE